MLDQNDYLNRAIGAGVGYATYKGATNIIEKYVRQPYDAFVMEPLIHCNPSEKRILKDAALQAFDDSGLKNRGVVFNNVTTENVQKINTEIIKKYMQFLENMLRKFGYSEEKITLQKAIIEEKIIPKYSNKTLEMLKTTVDGENAFYHPISKTVNINLNKVPITAFHEFGHALNNTDKYTKFLVYGRHSLARLTPLILAVGLLKNKKQEGEAPKDNLDKTSDFVKNNAGKLTFVSFVPEIAEEGLASVRGSKMAKPLLSKELFKKLNCDYLKALGTYVLWATIAALSVRLAVAVRDAIMTNKNKEAQV